MKNKIDLLTCSFSDKELEKKYQDVRWNEVSSFYSNVLKFFLIIGIIYLLSLYLRNSLDFKTVFSPLIQVLIPIFLLSKNSFIFTFLNNWPIIGTFFLNHKKRKMFVPELQQTMIYSQTSRTGERKYS